MTPWAELPEYDRAHARSVVSSSIAATREELARKRGFALAHPEIQRAQEHVVRLEREVAALEALIADKQSRRPPWSTLATVVAGSRGDWTREQVAALVLYIGGDADALAQHPAVRSVVDGAIQRETREVAHLERCGVLAVGEQCPRCTSIIVAETEPDGLRCHACNHSWERS